MSLRAWLWLLALDAVTPLYLLCVRKASESDAPDDGAEHAQGEGSR